MKAARQILRLNRKHAVSIIHAHRANAAGLAAAIASHFSRLPIVLTVHGSDVLTYGSKVWAKPFVNVAIGRAAAIIAPSVELADACLTLGSDANKVEVWANAVDIERFQPMAKNEKLARKLGISDSHTVALCLRRLVPKTGVQYLVEAAHIVAKHNRSIRFVIVGDGPLYPQLQQRVHELGIDDLFIFVGAVPNEMVEEYISLSNFAVFPSLTEATSIACLEVMAAGKPVIVSDVGGLPEIVEHGKTGLIVPFELGEGSLYVDLGLSDNALAELASSIIRLADAPAFCSTVGRAARRAVAEKYSWAQYAERLEHLYQRVLNGAH